MVKKGRLDDQHIAARVRRRLVVAALPAASPAAASPAAASAATAVSAAAASVGFRDCKKLLSSPQLLGWHGRWPIMNKTRTTNHNWRVYTVQYIGYCVPTRSSASVLSAQDSWSLRACATVPSASRCLLYNLKVYYLRCRVPTRSSASVLSAQGGWSLHACATVPSVSWLLLRSTHGSEM